jgi:acetyl esterase/lipase
MRKRADGTYEASPGVSGDPTIVDLWPGKPPGDVGVPGEEYTRIYDGPLTGPTRLITNVMRPTITIYRPRQGTNNGTAIVICPGGGYHDLFWELEGEEVAAWCNEQGMTGIVLKYRCPRRPGDVKGVPPLGPQLDAQRAVSMVRSRAKEWGIDPGRIGIIGFSVGGHLAIATATNHDRRSYEPVDAHDKASPRPDFAIPCYSGYLKAEGKDDVWPGIRLAPGTPPVMLVHSSDDSIAGSENSVIMYLALKRAGIPTELHVYATGEHDFGVRRSDKLPSSWTGLCLRWLRSFGFLPAGT